MFVEITQDKIDLIAKIIKSNPKFSNNEDLYEDFLNESCQRSISIINAIESESTLESYLRKVVTTSMISVLKDLGRLRRTKSGYVPTKEVSIDTVAYKEPTVAAPITAAPTAAPTMVPTMAPTSAPTAVPTSVPNSLHDLVDYSSYVIDYASVSIPLDPEENALHNEIIDFVADSLEEINANEPKKRFMDIFIMRYDKCMTQKQMAKELGISQAEVSKRIYGLLDRMKSVLNEQ